MQFCGWWPNNIIHHLVEFGSHEPYENRDTAFLLITRLSCHVTIVDGEPFSLAISISSLVDMAMRKLRYNIFYLLRDLT